MPLSADAQALLELLLARGQTYDDIASLLDVTPDEARSRARAALTELAGTDPDKNVALTDWILGQADPIGRADVARHLREDREDHRVAAGLISALGEIAPGAEFPKLPPEPSAGRFTRRPAAKPPAPVETPKAKRAARPRGEGDGRLSALTEDRPRFLAILGGGAVLLIVVVLAVAGVFGGDGDSTSSASDSTTDTTASADDTQNIQTVPLKATSGGDAEGTATFGIASGSQAFVDLNIRNLEPAPSGKAYVLWLLLDDQQGHPLSPFQVTENGTYHEQIPIASFLTQIAARTQFVDVSLSPRKPLLTAVQDAVDKNTPVIEFTGESIMRGAVPSAGGQDATTP